jgi:diacylglycerol kinase (ATP)
MRVILLHNPTAGHGKHNKKQLMVALTEAGHQATYQSTKKKGYEKALKKSADLMLVAGGDGTVAKIARRLIDSGKPISVLPLGTANNLARSLGFTRSVEDIIARLEHGRKHAFDVGIASGPWGKRYIFEGAGAGLLADYVRTARQAKSKAKKKKLSKEQEMAHHVSLLRRRSRDYRAQAWKIEIDGNNISGRYILWEAMNIRSVGPALYLAPWAATKDGEFDFVCVREEDRALLLEHLDSRLAGKKSKFPLPTRTFRKLKIAVKRTPVHLDDKLWPRQKKKAPKRFELKITVKPAALLILQPGGRA